MNISPVRIVARKELSDALRDKRSIYTILMPILFGPLVIAFMLHNMTGLKKSADEIRIPITGGRSSPVLVQWLQQQNGVEVVAGPTDAEAAVRDGTEDVVLVVKEDFAKNFRESKRAPVQILSNSTQKSAQPKLARLSSLLNDFSSEMGCLRLIARGISPEVASPLKVEEVDIATSQQRAATILNVMLMFLAVTIITAGMQIATDSTAGERERGSLEPLLLNPVPRWQLITGKWLAAAVLALAGMIATLVILSVVVGKLPLEELGIRFQLGLPKMLALARVMAPLALLISAIEVYLSCSAKSFKEAQSYTIFLILPVAFLGMFSMFHPLSSEPWHIAIPLLSQYLLGADILAGKTISGTALVIAGVEAALLSAVFVWFAARRFSTEKIIFGR